MDVQTRTGRGIAGDAGRQTAICTWFVADTAADATFFPQTGMRSDIAEGQAIYWRCTAVFFASSVAANPGRRHIFFTNTTLPKVDGVPFDRLFADLGVELVTLPITFRLPKGRVGSWGNQFYIFDVIHHLARKGDAARYVVLDSDVVWNKPVDEMEAAVDREGALTYELYGERAAGDEINGLSRVSMARFHGRQASPQREFLPYFGGEIFAATQGEVERIDEVAERVWPRVVAGEADAPKEEAHLLSILYSMLGYRAATANRFIRRMWTTFRVNNLSPTDLSLAVWHLPAEKKTGFAEIFARSIAPRSEWRDPASFGFGPGSYGATFGVPRRGAAKLVRDLGRKVAEKIGR